MRYFELYPHICAARVLFTVPVAACLWALTFRLSVLFVNVSPARMALTKYAAGSLGIKDS